MKTGDLAKNCSKGCLQFSWSHHQAICFKGIEAPTATTVKSEIKCESAVTTKSTGGVKFMSQMAKAFVFGADKSNGVVVNVFIGWRKPAIVHYRKTSEESFVGHSLNRTLKCQHCWHGEIQEI